MHKQLLLFRRLSRPVNYDFCKKILIFTFRFTHLCNNVKINKTFYTKLVIN